MRKFLPRGKFWIFNTRRGTSVPGAAPFARRRTTDRSPAEERVERQTVAGIHGGISFFLFSAACRDSLEAVGAAYRIKEPWVSHGVGGAKDEGREERERRNRPGRETRNIFYSRCGLDPTPYLFLNPLWRPSSLRVLPRDASNGPPRGVRCFRWIDSRVLPLCKLPFPPGERFPLLSLPPSLALSLSLPISTLTKPVDSTSRLTTNQRS